MAKRLNNENTIGDVLKFIIKENKLQGGIDEISVKDAWKSMMGNGVNSYTKSVVLKNSTLYVELTSAVLREELSYRKKKSSEKINEELRRDVIKDVFLK